MGSRLDRSDRERAQTLYRDPNLSSSSSTRRSPREPDDSRYLREANKKLLMQNQKLLNEMEKCSQEVNGSRAKVLNSYVFSYRQKKTN